jgi:hypothetical protein
MTTGANLLPTSANLSPDASNNNSALIAGIVGGIVALLLLLGLIVFLVARSRRAKDSDGHSLQTVAQPASVAAATAAHGNYDRININIPSYDDVHEVRSPYESVHDKLT